MVAVPRVEANPGPSTYVTAQTSCVLGAVAGVRYTYTVIARSTAGDSAPSLPSNAVVAAAPAAPATLPDNALRLTTDQGNLPVTEPGGLLVVRGWGYARNSTVTLTVYSTPIALGRVTTNDKGVFHKTIAVPASFAGQSHSLVALGTAPDGSLRAMRLTITVAGTTVTMPVTGAPVAWQALSALLAIAMGLTLRLFPPLPLAPAAIGPPRSTAGDQASQLRSRSSAYAVSARRYSRMSPSDVDSSRIVSRSATASRDSPVLYRSIALNTRSGR